MVDFAAGFGSGSNSWVIGGKFTKSGKPIVANDPHLHSALPGEWYQIEIKYSTQEGRNVSMIGGSMVGLPIIVGKTQYAAFGFTTIHGDTIDLYREDVKDNSYLFKGERIPLKHRKEVIKI